MCFTLLSISNIQTKIMRYRYIIIKIKSNCSYATTKKIFPFFLFYDDNDNWYWSNIWKKNKFAMLSPLYMCLLCRNVLWISFVLFFFSLSLYQRIEIIFKILSIGKTNNFGFWWNENNNHGQLWLWYISDYIVEVLFFCFFWLYSKCYHHFLDTDQHHHHHHHHTIFLISSYFRWTMIVVSTKTNYQGQPVFF